METFFSYFGGIGVVIVSLIAWIGRIQENRIMAKDDHNFATKLEELKTELNNQANKRNLAFNLYITGQFDIYSKLWSSLVELEDAVDELWEGVDRKRFNNFSSAIKKAKSNIRKAAPFIEQQHYETIEHFFGLLDEYRNGKERILSFDNMSDDEFNSKIHIINRFVDQNRETKEAIHQFAEACLLDFRNKLGG